MTSPRGQFFRTTAGLAALTAIFFMISWRSYEGQAQSARIIKLVVPFPAGGSADTLARLLADQIGQARGSTWVIENRPGAGGLIAYEAVSRAAPDGNTLLVTAPSFVINPQIRKTSYDPLTQFEPICYLVRVPLLIVVSSASPYRTLADLLTAARLKPGELSVASIGPATIQQIALERLKRSANVDIMFVPYPGNPPAVNALLGGHVTAVLANSENVLDHVNSGKLRALATASRTRIESLPQIPTISEAGLDGYEVDNWFGLVAPSNTPKDAVIKFAEWAKAAMIVPDVKTKLENLGLYPVGICGADFGRHIHNQYEYYGRFIREANIQVQ